MKAIKFIMGVAVALSLGFSAVSCSNDDYDFTDTNKNISQIDVKNTIAKAEVDISYMFSEDFLKNFDATIVYTDSNGTEHREAIDTKNTTVELKHDYYNDVEGGIQSNVYTYNKVIATSIPQNINVHIDVVEKATPTSSGKDYDYMGFGYSYKTKVRNVYGEEIKNVNGASKNEYLPVVMDTGNVGQYHNYILKDMMKLCHFTFNFSKSGKCNVITQSLSK